MQRARNSFFERIIAMLLTAVMLATSVPLDVYAAATGSDSPVNEDSSVITPDASDDEDASETEEMTSEPETTDEDESVVVEVTDGVQPDDGEEPEVSPIPSVDPLSSATPSPSAMVTPTPSANEEPEIIEGYIEFDGEIYTDDSLPDDNELLEGYLDNLIENEVDNVNGQRKLYAPRQTNLPAREKRIYNKLRAMIQRVAAGETDSPVITITLADLTGSNKTTYSAAELGVSNIISGGAFTNEAKQAVNRLINADYAAVMHALLNDCPYDLYWFDKTSSGSYNFISTGFHYSYSSANPNYVQLSSTNIWTMVLYPSKDYSKNGGYKESKVNTAKTRAAKQAVERAKTVVALYAEEDDYTKLLEYKNWICRNVAYNYPAANSSTPYGNPWQLIWAFDDDPDTKIVCEGYSKAFKLLCDLSDWDWEIFDCYLMSGNVSEGLNSGAHMWNIVQMDDAKNYLIDVTWSDTNGSNDGTNRYFLKAGSQNGSNPMDKCFVIRYVGEYSTSNTVYTYDDLTISMYSSAERTVSTSDYAHIPTYKIRLHPGEGTCGRPSIRIVQNATTYGDYGNYPVAVSNRAGYKFDGWYTAAEDGTKITSDTPFDLTGDSDLYAHYAPITYTVKFNPNQYSIPNGNPGHYDNVTGETTAVTCTYDEETPLTVNGFVSDSHRFKYWTTAANGKGTVYTDGINVKNLTTVDGQEINLYAQWEIKHFTVTFDHECDSLADKTFNYDYGKYVTVPAQPVRTGYIFGGWYTDESFDEGSKFDFKNTYVTSDLTLHAKWTPITYKVVFDVNQYTIPAGNPGRFGNVIGTTGSMDCTYDVPAQLTPNGYSSISHDFKGWNTTKDGKGTSLADNEEISNLTAKDGSVVTLYAKWEIKHYKVTFDHKCEELSDKEFTYNYGDYVASPVIPARTGYLFLGWFKDEDCIHPFDFNTEQVFSDLTLYAKWTPIRYKIVYDGNGADAPDSVAIPDRTCAYDEDPFYLSDNTFKKTGYTFKCWNTKPDGSGEVVGYTMPNEENGLESPQKITVSNLASKDDEVVTLYAQWEIVKYNVKINFNTVALSPGITDQIVTDQNNVFAQHNIDIDKEHDSVIEEPELPEHEGYRFAGWYSNEELTNRFVFPHKVTADTVVYAKWVKVWTVTIKLNGGRFYNPAESVFDDNDISSFAKMDSVSFTIDDDGVTTIAQAINSNNGRDDYSLSVDWSDTNSLKPFRTRYDFDGWFYPNGTAVNFGAVLNSDVIINAKWTPKYKVNAPKASVDSMSHTDPDRKDAEEKPYLYESAVIKLSSSTPGARIYRRNSADGEWIYTTDAIKISALADAIVKYIDRNGNEITDSDHDGIDDNTSEEAVGYEVRFYAKACKNDCEDSDITEINYTVIMDMTDRGGIISDEDWEEYKALGRPESVWIAGIDSSGYMYKGAAITFVPGEDDGDPATNNIRVYDGKKLLALSKDYTLSYKNNINAYTLVSGNDGFNASKAPSVIVTCRGNFSGSYTKTFKINPQDLSTANTSIASPLVTLAEKKDRSGISQIQRPANTVKYLLPTAKTVTLKNASDYRIEYPEAAAGGPFALASSDYYRAEIHGNYDPVKGTGNYTGVTYFDVYIVPTLTALSKASFGPELTASYPYSGTAVTPLIPMEIPAEGENPAIPASVIYKRSKTEIISLKGIDEAAYLTLSEADKRTYDYTYRYEGDTVNIGNVKIVMTGINGYSGTVTKSYKIIGTPLTATKFTSEYNTKYNALYNAGRGTPYNGTEKKLPEDDHENGIMTYSYKDADKVPHTDKLVLDTDYTIKYFRGTVETTDLTSAGTITVVYTGIGLYTGTIKKSYKIKPIGLNAKYFTDAYNAGYNLLYNGNKGVVYDGLEKRPAEDGILIWDGVTLIKDTDYTVTYYRGNKVTDDLKSVGTITVTYAGKGNYSGKLNKTYKITAYSFTNDENLYMGASSDYRINVSLPDDVVYLKGGVKPVPTVTFDAVDGLGNIVETTELTNGKDFTVTYYNNTAANTKDGEGNWTNPKKIPYIKITGKGNFAGTIPGIARKKYAPDDLRFVYEIHRSAAVAERVKLEAADRVYTNKKNNYTTSVILTDSDNKRLVAGTDYDKVFRYYYTEDTQLADVNLSYQDRGLFRKGETTDAVGNVTALGDEVLSGDIVPVGTILRIQVDLKNNYTGTLSDTFRLYGQDISKASVRVNTQYYTGREVCPDKTQIAVTLSGRVLADQDYEIVSYTNNINKGTAKVTIAGVGDYGGTKTVNFTIANKLNAGNNCIIIFNGNGATGGSMGNQTLGYHDTKVYNLKTNGYKRANYAFKGWNTKPDGTGIDFTKYVNKKDPVYKQIEAAGTWASLRISNAEGADTDLVGKTLILYAQWEPARYYVVFHNNGGKNNPLNTDGLPDDGSPESSHGLGTLSKDSDGRFYYRADYQDIKIHAPEREDWPLGYQFGGWYKENNYKNKIGTIKTGTSGDIHIYAKWVPYTYTVVFDIGAPEDEIAAKKASGRMVPETFSYGIAKKLTKNAYKRTGYVFLGWSREKNQANPEFKDTESVLDLVDRRNSQTGQITLYAVWRNIYFLDYEVNGGTMPSTAKDNATNAAVDAGLGFYFITGVPKVIDIKYLFCEGVTEDTRYIYQYGKAYSLPTPLRTGYSFGGWYKDEKFKTRLTSIPKTMYGDTTLYAKWNPNTYKIVFNGEGRTAGSVTAQNVKYDATVALNKNNFVKNGYVFAGWSTKSYAARTQDMTEEETEAFKVAYDNDPTSGLAEGVDYYADSAQIINPIGPDGVPILSGTLNLYALWKKVNHYSVFFVTNGGTNVGKDLEHVNTAERLLGTALNLNEKNEAGEYVFTPVRRGYTFAGWYKEPTFKTRMTSVPANTYTDMTLYAKWTPLTYKIAYNKNLSDQSMIINWKDLIKTSSGSVAKQNAKYDTYITLNKNNFAVQTKRFGWWNTRPDGTGTRYSDGELVNIMPTRNGETITLYAIWQNVDYYKVAFESNGGTDIPEAERGITEDLHLNDPAYIPVRDGYNFAGWYKEPNFKTRLKKVSKTTYSDATVYAKWTPKAYKIIFNASAPEGVKVSGKTAAETLNYGSAKALTANGFSIKGYTFEGWSRSSGGDVQYLNKQAVSDIYDHYEAVVNLYAVWKRADYGIIYNNVTGIDNSANPDHYNIDEEVILKEPENMGDTFLGWYSDSRMTKKVTSIPKGSTGVKTLYAKWAKTQYTINYNINCPDETVVLDTSRAGFITSYDGNVENGYILATADRTGYSFAGWYKEAACRTAVGPIVSTPYVDMTVYAKWVPNVYTVKYVRNAPNYPSAGVVNEDVKAALKSNGAISEDLVYNSTGADMRDQSVKYDASVKPSACGYKVTGHKFIGWSKVPQGDVEPVIKNFCTGENGDKEITLYAQWELEQYKLNYVLNGGQNNAENPLGDYTIESETIEIKDPTRNGYIFGGWYNNKNFSGPKITSIPSGSTGNKTLYAKWIYYSSFVTHVDTPDEYINVRSYNAIPNDGVDDTAAINKAIRAASAGTGGTHTLYIPAGTYDVTSGDMEDYDGEAGCCVTVQSNVDIVMEYGAILRSAPVSGAWDYAVVSLPNTKNSTITGGCVEGELNRHNGTKGESGHGISLNGSTNVTISNMVVRYACGDGIYLGYKKNYSTYAKPTNTTIVDCEIYGNRRNNIGVTDAYNLTIDHCNIYDAYGTPPHCGIYFEPNWNSRGRGMNDRNYNDEIIRNVTIRNSVISSYHRINDTDYGWCIMTHQNPYDSNYWTVDYLTVENCICYGWFGNYSGTHFTHPGTTFYGTYRNRGENWP